ncbi:MAG TPA: hypothetical protein PKD24_16290 [Pyrinomonadaceae bacterium]|nr:hypothetical protein [Pyrinomonadaceae bacterium]HMP66926.1 hypothetical protein [Pyrinomonadaceae bacterium]
MVIRRIRLAHETSAKGRKPRPFTTGFEIEIWSLTRFIGLAEWWLRPGTKRTLNRSLDLLTDADHAVNNVANAAKREKPR